MPLEFLVLHYGNAEFKGFLDQDDHHDTMIGGLKITSYSEGSGAWVSSTLGWYFTWYESGWKEGIIIAGHATCDDSASLKKIYQ